MSSHQHKKPFQKFGKGGGRKPFHKPKKGNKRQRFVQNAKGYGKKGNFGRGTHIEEEDFRYFLGILEVQTQTPGASWEEKVAMANNVMEQTKDKEINLSSNQIVSKVLENLLGFVDAEHLERYFEVFGEDLRPICSDDFGAHVLEKLIEIAFIRAVGTVAEEDHGPMVKRPKELVTELNYNTTHEFTAEHRTKCSEFVVRISKFLLNNLEDFVNDPNACYLLRTAILSLAGVHIPKTIFLNGNVINNTDKFNGFPNFHRLGEFKIDKTIFKTTEEWLEILMEFPERLQMWPHFKEFPYNSRNSILLQVICIALFTVDKTALNDFGKKLLNDAFKDVKIPKTPFKKQFLKKKNSNENDTVTNEVDEKSNGNGNDDANSESAEDDGKTNVEPSEDNESKDVDEEDDDEDKPSVFKTDSSVRLLQALISIASPQLLTEIYTQFFEGRILSLANNNFGFFAVQRFINYVLEKSQFEAIFDDLCPHFEKFIEGNKSNLVASISGTCLRLKAKQAAFVTALQNSLHCNASLGADRPKAFFNCLVKLKPFEVLPYDQKTYIGIFGSLMIQDILQFNKPIFLVNSILETPIKCLVEILQCANGSFIADKFFSSPTIGEKSREKFIKLFEGFYMDMALTKSGSRVVEILVKSSNDAQKVAIAKELTLKENKLKGSVFGRIIYNSLRLDTFKLSQEQWKASWSIKEEDEPVDTEKTVVNMDTTEATTETTTKSPKQNKKNKKRPAS